VRGPPIAPIEHGKGVAMLAKLFSFWNSPTGRMSVPLFLVLSLLTPAYPQIPSDDLTLMNIEELMNVEVTSASGHEQSLS
jgi:hypothetical protein